ncbi:MAG: 23S rRNA (pseudouridine(1915)-N(3))-methyltransferase RlmH [Deltaproteobacteria bacterium]|nr:23S rRNA (pseudouridine(1915)-N(3))-methyltransferase RlmH [Deltaproteobacteria bacterium]
MHKAVLLCVGRLKTTFWKEAVALYRQRLRPRWRIQEINVRDSGPDLPPEAVRERDGAALLAALPAGHTHICLDERGTQFTSPELAEWLQKLWDASAPPCFIIGGPWGLTGRVLEAADLRLSLSRMTLPHELAHVLLWEQLFRADSILRRTGYHH